MCDVTHNEHAHVRDVGDLSSGKAPIACIRVWGLVRGWGYEIILVLVMHIADQYLSNAGGDARQAVASSLVH